MPAECCDITMTRTPRLLFNRMALVLYCPVSCILIGLLSAYIGRITFHRIVVFQGGFLQYAIPFPGYAGTIQFPGMVLGFLTFALFIFSRNSSQARISVLQIRVFLTILIALIALPVKIMMISAPLDSTFEAWVRLIFIAVHLTIAFFATFLPSLQSEISTAAWAEAEPGLHSVRPRRSAGLIPPRHYHRDVIDLNRELQNAIRRKVLMHRQFPHTSFMPRNDMPWVGRASFQGMRRAL